ncbi:MAG TPA: ester cyclase [Longimicrobiales bacterium]|nr:ester cyclase [Longimicrobiales bacterium]
MSAENKAVIRRYVEECIGKNDLSLMDDLLDAGYVWHAPSGDFDLQAYKQFQPSVLAAFPDGYWTIDDMIAEGDRVAWRFTFHGTHRGEFMGFPGSGRRVTMSGMVISRIAHGRIAEEWELWDGAGLAQQLGPQ